MLSLDPLYVASKGERVAGVPHDDTERLLDVMGNVPLGRNTAVIGEVVADHPDLVVQQSLIGGERAVSMLWGEPLARTC